jgi:glycosyltransferase involved in cell wall biosynthesis
VAGGQLVTTLWLVSLNYSPGLAKEMTLLGEQFRDRGWNCRYLLDERYDWLVDDEHVHWVGEAAASRSLLRDTARSPSIGRRSGRLFDDHGADVVLFYNTHPTHLAVALAAPGDAEIVTMLHEPYVPEKRVFGTLGRLIFHGNEAIQTAMLKLADTAIFPSRWAYNRFHQKYDGYDGRLLYAPLLVPDVDLDRQPKAEREYVTWVGHVNQGRLLSEFLALADHAVGRDPSVRFRIVTTSSIDDALADVDDAVRESIDVQNPDRLSDEDIARAIAGSLAVVLTHRHVTQSGTVPVAYRHGTPVIARELPGFTQDVIPGETGDLLPVEFDPTTAFESVESIYDRFETMSSTARTCYEKRFSPAAWGQYYEEFAERIDGR